MKPKLTDEEVRIAGREILAKMQAKWLPLKGGVCGILRLKRGVMISEIYKLDYLQ